MKTGVKVMDAMTSNPVVVGPELNLKQCAISMVRNKVGSVIVKKEGKLLGIVTAKDFVKAIANDVDPEEVRVGDVMVRKIRTIKPDEDIYAALMQMSKKDVRRLPVVHNKELVGVLTINDVLKIQPRLQDLLAEKFRIGFSPRKKSAVKYLEGECENCGNYAELFDARDKLLCANCKPL
jgi:CBS domain-containing protein